MLDAEAHTVARELFEWLYNLNPDATAWFAHPVDPLMIPDYYKRIKSPMDFGTIRTKLSDDPSTSAYAAFIEFVDDVKLVFKNAKRWNANLKPIEGLTNVKQHAENLDKQFDSQIKQQEVAKRLLDDGRANRKKDAAEKKRIRLEQLQQARRIQATREAPPALQPQQQPAAAAAAPRLTLRTVPAAKITVAQNWEEEQVVLTKLFKNMARDAKVYAEVQDWTNPAVFPHWGDVNRRPISFNQIRDKLKMKSYVNIDQIIDDVETCFLNGIRYFYCDKRIVNPGVKLLDRFYKFIFTSTPSAFGKKNPEALINFRLKACRDSLEKIQYDPLGNFFAKPALCFGAVLPRYEEIVTKPMDLSKILTKLHTMGYSDPKQFVDDVHLMLDNCVNYQEQEGGDLRFAEEVLKLRQVFNSEFTKSCPDVDVGPEHAVVNLKVPAVPSELSAVAKLAKTQVLPPKPVQPRKRTMSEDDDFNLGRGGAADDDEDFRISPEEEMLQDDELPYEAELFDDDMDDYRIDSFGNINSKKKKIINRKKKAPKNIRYVEEDSDDDYGGPSGGGKSRSRQLNISGPFRPAASSATGPKSWKTICKEILQRLLVNSEACKPFMHPFDWRAAGASDYPQIVTKPRDLSLVKKRINSTRDSKYDSFEEFATDLRLVFNNALTYNRTEDPSFPVRSHARRLSAAFERMYAQALPTLNASRPAMKFDPEADDDVPRNRPKQPTQPFELKRAREPAYCPPKPVANLLPQEVVMFKILGAVSRSEMLRKFFGMDVLRANPSPNFRAAYLRVVPEPLCIEQMMDRVNCAWYSTRAERELFKIDVFKIFDNALKFNVDARDATQNEIRDAAALGKRYFLDLYAERLEHDKSVRAHARKMRERLLSKCPVDVKLADHRRILNGKLTGSSTFKYNQYFLHPVEWERLGLHDYPVVVAKPMDFSTIKKKEYQTYGDFAKDVRLVFSNCLLYNKPGIAESAKFREAARKMSDVFEAAWAEFTVSALDKMRRSRVRAKKDLETLRLEAARRRREFVEVMGEDIARKIEEVDPKTWEKKAASQKKLKRMANEILNPKVKKPKREMVLDLSFLDVDADLTVDARGNNNNDDEDGDYEMESSSESEEGEDDIDEEEDEVLDDDEVSMLFGEGAINADAVRSFSAQQQGSGGRRGGGGGGGGVRRNGGFTWGGGGAYYRSQAAFDGAQQVRYDAQLEAYEQQAKRREEAAAHKRKLISEEYKREQRENAEKTKRLLGESAKAAVERARIHVSSDEEDEEASSQLEDDGEKDESDEKAVTLAAGTAAVRRQQLPSDRIAIVALLKTAVGGDDAETIASESSSSASAARAFELSEPAKKGARTVAWIEGNELRIGQLPKALADAAPGAVCDSASVSFVEVSGIVSDSHRVETRGDCTVDVFDIKGVAVVRPARRR